MFTLFGGNDAVQLRRIEQKLDLIMKHLGIEYTEPTMTDEILQLISEGQKIGAIKKYRELTGVGLKEAKDAIERQMASGS